VRGDQLPFPGFLLPHIRKAVVVIVGLLAVHSFFVIHAGDNGRVTMQPDAHFRDFRDLDVRGTTGAVRQISCLAVRASILKGNHEVIIQHRGKHLHFVMFVAVQKLEFEGLYIGRLGRILRT